jgi:mycothiol synthase
LGEALSRQAEIRRAESDDDLAGYAEVWNATTPREPITVAETKRRLERQPWRKRTQLAWAAERGYRELVTYTQEGNETMRAINEKLGYRARPAWILVRREAV